MILQSRKYPDFDIEAFVKLEEPKISSFLSLIISLACILFLWIISNFILEQYFLRLGEQGDRVTTNLSDLTDDELEELSNWAIDELSAGNKQKNTVIHPHTGEVQIKKVERKVKTASSADL